MTKSTYKRKIKDIRYHYGNKAVIHFDKHPYCEVCLEKRIILLCVHHPEGKAVNKFKTLCHNCHMLEHNKKAANDTYQSYINNNLKKEEASKQKDLEVLNMLNEQIPIRDIVIKAHTCLNRIHKVAKENGFVTRQRSGYDKIN